MEKVIAFILLLNLSLVKLEAQINKNQDVPLQLNQASCPEDDEFEYDDFEKLVKDFRDKEKIEILPYFEDYIDECRTAIDIKKCLEDKFLWYDLEHLDSRSNVEIADEIGNGITIIYTNVCENEPSGGIIALSSNRHDPDEDLEFGTNGDGTGLMLGTATEIELWEYMDNLFYLATRFGNLNNVAQDYLALFRSNTSNSYKYFHYGLSEEVRKSPEMRNFIKRFGEELNNILKIRGGNFPTQLINLGVIHPQWNGGYNLVNGFQILINDTEQSFVKKVNYSFDPNTGNWEGEFWFNVTDNFGLDKHDALEYQPFSHNIGIGDIKIGHLGFPAWWRLQRQKNKVPFITDIRICAKIKGKID